MESGSSVMDDSHLKKFLFRRLVKDSAPVLPKILFEK